MRAHSLLHTYTPLLISAEAARQLSNLLKRAISASLVPCVIEEIDIEARFFLRASQGARRLLGDVRLGKRAKPGTKQSHIGNHLMLNDAIEVLCDFLPPILVADLRPIGKMEPVYYPVN